MTCKDLIPIVSLIRKLSSAAGLDASFVSNIHCKVHEDNVGALTLCHLEPRCMTACSKHYAIKYHWFGEKVAELSQKITLNKIETTNQLGDPFTKGLTCPFATFIDGLVAPHKHRERVLEGNNQRPVSTGIVKCLASFSGFFISSSPRYGLCPVLCHSIRFPRTYLLF
jgi:hypothetical protein